MPGTVTVACKVANGLIVQVYTSVEEEHPVMGGGYKKVKTAYKTGPRIKLNGPAVAYGKPAPHDIRNACGLTYGVDADTFNKWLEQNKDSDFVKGGLVFAHVKSNEVEAQAKDHLALKSGLEEIDPNNLPPEFNRKITTAPR